MRVIIAGSRHYRDYESLKEFCDNVLANTKNVEIVSGGASGADRLGELYASEKGYPVKVFLAEWKKHGKAAGPIRNRKMAVYAEGLIAFWNGRSRGTKSMIKQAQALGLKIRIKSI